MLKFELKKPNELQILIALNGKSVRGFSEEIGISHSFLSQVISGKRNPSATTAGKISKGLNKEIEDFFLVKVVDELPLGRGEKNVSSRNQCTN